MLVYTLAALTVACAVWVCVEFVKSSNRMKRAVERDQMIERVKFGLGDYRD